MYLPEGAVLELFSQVAAQSATRTSILFDYFFKDLMSSPERYHGGREWVDRATKVGEEPRYGIARGEAGAVVARSGLRLVSECDMAELADRYLRRADGTSISRPYDFAAVAHAAVGD